MTNIFFTRVKTMVFNYYISYILIGMLQLNFLFFLCWASAQSSGKSSLFLSSVSTRRLSRDESKGNECKDEEYPRK